MKYFFCHTRTYCISRNNGNVQVLNIEQWRMVDERDQNSLAKNYRIITAVDQAVSVNPGKLAV
jgi:hypothetical protein